MGPMIDDRGPWLAITPDLRSVLIDAPLDDALRIGFVLRAALHHEIHQTRNGLESNACDRCNAERLALYGHR